jgi:hypothetical protein
MYLLAFIAVLILLRRRRTNLDFKRSTLEFEIEL